jgi:hypothetical protein
MLLPNSRAILSESQHRPRLCQLRFLDVGRNGDLHRPLQPLQLIDGTVELALDGALVAEKCIHTPVRGSVRHPQGFGFGHSFRSQVS